MYAGRILALSLGICICITSMCASSGNEGGSSQKEPITVLVEYSEGRLTYTVDSRHVAPADCLRVLGDAVRKRGELSTVLVFADERISFERMENLRGLIYKSGSANVRYFVFGSDRSLMQEVHFDKAVPYTLTVK